MPRPSDAEIEAALLHLAHARGSGKTFCPSEVAREMSPDWRNMMPDIRRVAAQLQGAGRLVATQKGVVVDARTARGPIRLGQPRS
ncbi:MAG: DUF3253 domain-containing protein [Pseudomonadota bacterium]